jgi:nucleotidyltransferase substrate binding protein (TIGR01987 family)
MTKLNTDHLERCIRTLQLSLEQLDTVEQESINYEVFRNATIKGFELVLETAGKLLRKALKNYVSGSRFVDELTYKDVFRHAAKHGLIDSNAVERWFAYRDNRNNTAHDYGISFATTTLTLLPSFLEDAKALLQTLKTHAKS